MKNILLGLILFSVNTAFSQENDIVVKAQKQSISVSLDADNADRSLIISSNKKAASTDKILIYNGHYLQEKDWKRTFTIYDEADVEVARFPAAVKDRYYEIPLKGLQAKLQKEKEYSLYTMAIPKDSKRAAAVRVRRVLICKLRVK